MKRTYSPEEKAKALAACAELGPGAASRQLGIPKGTVSWWATMAGVKSSGAEKVRAATEAREAHCAAKRAELKELLITNAVDLGRRMHEPHIDFKTAAGGVMEVTYPKATAQACQQYATAIGILLDKFRLESGEVTSRDEHRNVSESQLDREIATLLEELERRAQGSDQGPTPADEMGLVPGCETEATAP